MTSNINLLLLGPTQPVAEKMEDEPGRARTGIFLHLWLKALESIQAHWPAYFLALLLVLAPKYIRRYRLRRNLNSLPLVGSDGLSIGQCVEEGSRKVSVDETVFELRS